MKPERITKKLELNKTTITTLDVSEMDNVKGGWEDYPPTETNWVGC